MSGWREAAVVPGDDVVETAPDALGRVRSGTSLGRRILFLLNYEPQPQLVKVRLPAPASEARDLFSTAGIESHEGRLFVTLRRGRLPAFSGSSPPCSGVIYRRYV